jgi:hypothetical protein
MGILRGNISLARFATHTRTMPKEEICAKLIEHRFRPFEGGSDKERVGWAEWRNPLITDLDPDWILQDGYAAFALRVDTRQVPSALLKNHLMLRIEKFKKQEDLAFVPKETQKEMKEELEEELLRKVVPTTKSYEVVWDLREQTIWTNASSKSAQSQLLGHLMATFRIKFVLKTLLDIDDSVDKDTISEDFILWLWKESLVNSGRLGVPGDDSVCHVEGPILLTSESGDVHEITLAKGNPQESIQAFEALRRGIKPRICIVRLFSTEKEFSFRLSADGLTMSGIKLPKPEVKTSWKDLLSERIDSLKDCISLMEARYRQFLLRRNSSNAEGEQIRNWIEAGIKNSAS